MIESTYTVRGMACRHCADLVAKEIERVTGVTTVAIDVETGAVTVTSDRNHGLSDVRAAVEEAGYELTPAQQIAGQRDRSRTV